jgi:predicted CxxxxCH...CXXCH cytochrome family protein
MSVTAKTEKSKLNQKTMESIKMKLTKRSVTLVTVIILSVVTTLLVGVLPVAAADSPMLHNSNRFPATTKHGGAWGLPGAKYGEFSCGTCHAKNTGNIKRVKKTITAPNTPTDKFPIEADLTPPAGGVNLQDARDGSSDFGDDARAVNDESTNICEACHTYDPAQLVGVKFHGYDMSGPGDSGHYNKADCMICHPHSQGFKPQDCDSCHGYPPIDTSAGGTTGLANNPYATGSTTAGAHQKHAIDLSYACTNCHDSYNMPQESAVNSGFGDISISFNNFGSLTGAYTGQAGVSYNDAFGTGGENCSNVYCHSTGQSADGTSATPSAYSTPSWSGAAACGTCHNDTNPGTGSHTIHIGTGATCNDCHVGNTHVDRQIDVTVGTYTLGGAPGNGYGSCSTASCHDSVQGDGAVAGVTVVTPDWGTSTVCGECHNTVPTTGSHNEHLAVTGVQCDSCHATAGDGSLVPTANHVDTNIDVINGYPAVNPIGDATYSTCSTASCHDNGTGNLVTTPAWGTPSACAECHAAAPGTGAHTKHFNAATVLISALDCANCHRDAVQAVSPATGQHDVDGDGNLDVYNTNPGDLGYSADVATTAPLYNTETCNTSYCHGDNMPAGTTSGTNNAPTWGATSTGCNFCHDMAPAAIGAHAGKVATDCATCHNHVNAAGTGFTNANLHLNGIVENDADSCTACHTGDIDGGLAGVHNSHADIATFLSGKTVSGNNYGDGSWYTTTYVNGKANFGCGQCHPDNEGTSHPINGLNLDIDNKAATFIKEKNAAQSTPTFATRSSITCASVYCHSDAAAAPVYATTPNWYGGTVSGNCNDCHNNGPASGTHANHTVGIHYETLYSGASGLMASNGNGGSGAAHGDSATADTIGCQSCHNNTVAVEYNSTNSICTTCHADATGSPAIGDEKMIINTGGSTHVNGTADVVFDNFASFKSKAQVRDFTAAEVELDSNWTRNGAYKTNAGFDQGKVATPSYAGGSCSNVSCHNGINTPTWNTGFAGNCRACHTTLP